MDLHLKHLNTSLKTRIPNFKFIEGTNLYSMRKSMYEDLSTPVLMTWLCKKEVKISLHSWPYIVLGVKLSNEYNDNCYLTILFWGKC